MRGNTDNTNPVHTGGSTKSLSFEGVATGSKVYDVCRIFLATLQLVSAHIVVLACDCHQSSQHTNVNVKPQANHYSVEIVPDADVPEGTKTFQMSQITLRKSEGAIGSFK